MPVSAADTPLAHLSRYIYGTTRLGHDDVAPADRLAIARAARDTGAWFHTSDQYGDAIDVLAQMLAEDPTRVPQFIFKAGGNSFGDFRTKITDQLARIGLDRMDVVQLCFDGPLGYEFATGGPIMDQLRQLRAEGLVGRFVFEVFPWTSVTPFAALETGRMKGLVDAFIFYLNPLQRFAANPLWDAIVAHNFPVIAMRTVCGAPVHALRDVPGAAWVDYLQKRAAQVAPIFERSGVGDWAEFCTRFAFGFPVVKATVGSTSQPDNLSAFVRHAANPAPLPAAIQADLAALQRRWSAEVDMRAEPWTM